MAVPKYGFCIILEFCALWYLFWLLLQNTNGYSMALLCKCSSTVSRSSLITKVTYCMFLNIIHYVLFASDFRVCHVTPSLLYKVRFYTIITTVFQFLCLIASVFNRTSSVFNHSKLKSRIVTPVEGFLKEH